MFRSLRGSTAAKSAPPPPVHTPNAFAAKKAFAPPPVRRVSAAPEPEPEPEPEEEVGGEWAEAKYDYSGQVRSIDSALLPSGSTDCLESTRLVFEGVGRSGLTRGRQSTRDGTDFIRLVRMRPVACCIAWIMTLITASRSRWTGEINGRSGLFPMSYVKLL
jgi:hypothetical protein